MPRSTSSIDGWDYMTGKRFPLWLTLVPLAIGIIGYWTIWTGFRDLLAADLLRLLPGTAIEVTGFPYRVEAALTAPQIALNGPGLRAQARGEQVVINRGPWQNELTVIRTKRAEVSIAVPPIAGATLHITAPVAQTSLHLIDGRIVRFSTVFDTPSIGFGLLPVPLAAQSFEMHLRETPTPAGPATAATAPRQLQVVLAATGLRFAHGDPLTLAADFALTAPAPVRSFAGWRPTGTIELRSFALSDATGEVLGATLTAVPAPDGRLRYAGTLTTVCPETLRAAVAGLPPPAELRTRMAVRIALTLLPDAPLVLTPEGGWGPRPTRNQQPACPALRR